jgi:hypothetical protein
VPHLEGADHGGDELQEFTIKIARIERMAGSAAGDEVCLTFRFERGAVGFDLPVFLKAVEFDDTEMVQVARSRLSEIFLQLADQCDGWKLSDEALKDLAELNLRSSSKSG